MRSVGLSDKVAFIGRVGRDQHRDMFFAEYDRIQLDHSLVYTHPTEPTGQVCFFVSCNRIDSNVHVSDCSCSSPAGIHHVGRRR
jgi:sugar/nucleoside kinase (ribokinase family)